MTTTAITRHVQPGLQPEPLLGTGGNDGRLEFSTNFHQQLIELLGTSAKERARSLATARDLLDGTQVASLSDVPIGQFDPGKAGGGGSDFCNPPPLKLEKHHYLSLRSSPLHSGQ